MKVVKMTLVAAVLMAGCAKDTKQVPGTVRDNQVFSERGTVNLTSRVSATESVTLTINKNPTTGAVKVTRTVNTAQAGDEYITYGIGLTPTFSTHSGSLTIPESGTYYFIPFEVSQNAVSLSGGAIVTYSCECCATGQSGAASNCTLTGTISGGNFSVCCSTNGCEECGLNATERARNKTGVYLSATSMTINQ
jgi:hypothetical protein